MCVNEPDAGVEETDEDVVGVVGLWPEEAGIVNGVEALVLLGDSCVGKSYIVLRFVRGQFDPTSKVTVRASFLSQTIALLDSTTVKFEIWDTAGQERYQAADLVKLDVLLNGQPVDAMATIVHNLKAQRVGCQLVDKLKQVIDRTMCVNGLDPGVKEADEDVVGVVELGPEEAGIVNGVEAVSLVFW
ncbi:hypothetical protein Drorol1_Dr00013336 [Drosera rotundifolia]